MAIAAFTALIGCALPCHAVAPRPNGAGFQPAPNPPATQTPTTPPVKKILLNYNAAPWEQVLPSLAEHLRLALLMEVKPPGTFTYSDALQRTPTEALDLINGALLTRDFTLLRGPQFLAVAPLDKPLPPELVPNVGPDELAKRGANEFVSLTIQLKHVDPSAIQDDVKKFLSRHGAIAALSRLRLITLTDVAGNLRKALPAVTQLDEASRPAPPPGPAPAKLERVYPLRFIEGDKTLPVVAAILDKAGAAVAGPQNRSVVVMALETDHQRVQSVLDKLDVEPTVGTASPATIRKTLAPKSGDAAALSSSLQNIWPRRRSQMNFGADKASNLLLVEGPPEIVKQVEALVAELDAVAATKAATEKVYRPHNADAAAVYGTLQVVFAGTDVKLSLDPRGEAVVVRASPAEQARVAKLIEQLDGPTGTGGAPTEVALKLKHATASTLASTLGTLFPKPAALSYDAANNLLLIRAAPDTASKIQKLVERIDVQPGLGDRTEIVYRPKHATAADLNTMLTRLFPASTNVAVVASPAGNALIVSVPKELQEKLNAALEMIDVVDLSGPVVRVETYSPKHLTAANLLATLSRFFATRSDVVITLDARSQGIIVQAPDAIHRSIVAMLPKLDAAPDVQAALTTQVYKLRHSQPAELAATLQKLYPVDRTQTEVSAEPANGLLVVTATAEIHRKIAELLQKIDVPPEAKAEERIYRLDRLEPNAAATMLRTVFATDGKTSISVSGDGRTLVVQASKLVHGKIDALLAKLRQEQDAGGGNAAAAIRVHHATASQVAAALQAAMPEAQTIGRITYEPTSNAILFVGPEDLRRRIEKMIGTLDIDPNADMLQKEYPAKHVRAMELVRKLRFLLPTSSRTTVSHELDREVIVVLGPATGHERVLKILETIDVPRDPKYEPKREVIRIKNATASTLATTLQAAFPAGQYTATITADPYNNFVVVDAPPATLAEVKSLAERLDVSPASEKVEKTYALRKIKAGAVQTQLATLFPAPLTTVATAAADAQSIVVSASAELHERIQRVIAELDRAPAAGNRMERVFRLEYATASSIARSLQLALADADAQFVPDDSNRTVIASFDPRHESRIDELIKQADRPKAMSDRQIAVLPLATLEPSRAESIVKRIFDQDPSDVRPAIETTEFPPQMIVRGSVEQIKQVRGALAQLGEQPSGANQADTLPNGKRTEPLLRAIRIDRGSPRSAVEAVRRLWPRLRRNPLIVAGDDILPPPEGGTLAPAPEPKDASPRVLPGDANQPVTLSYGNNRLLVSSLDAAAVRLVEQLVDTLTEEPSPERGEFRVFALETADAADVAKAVDEAFNGSRQGQGGRRRFGGDRVRAVADPSGGSIIVRASMVDLVATENLIRTLDQKPTGKQVRSPRILPLKRAKADEVVAVLKEVYADYLQPGSGGPMSLPGFSAKASGKAQALAIGIDQASNSLVIAAADEVYEQIKTLVGDLDKTLGEGGRSYRLLPLKNASPLDVEEALDILFDRPADPKRKAASPARRTAPTRNPRATKSRNAQSNRKSTSSTNEPGPLPPLSFGKPRGVDRTAVATIRSARDGVEVDAEQLSAPNPDSPSPAPDRNQGAAAASSRKEKLDAEVAPAGFVEAAKPLAQAPPPDELGAIGTRVEIRALPEIGVLLLLGDETELKMLADIVQRIERLATDRRLNFRILPLAHAKSSALADLLRDLYRRVLDSRNAQSRTEAQAEVIPLAKPNALLLAASKDDLDMLADLANQFDTPTAADGQFTVFKLEHARATDLSRTIQSFYQNRVNDGDLAPQIVVEADPRSNSMIVHAAPRDLDEVKLLVKQLDTAQTAFTNSLRVFPLRFGTADEIARVLQGAIQGAGTPSGETATGAAARARPSLQLILADGKNRKTVESSILDMVRITPNPRANTLIVSAPAQTMNLIEALIKQLDVRPEAQAEIKVFTLANSDAAAMVLTLRTLFLQAQGPNRNTTIAPTAAAGPATGDTGSPLIELSFSVDARTNSILAAGTRDQLEVVEAIILRLDGSNIEERKTEVLKLRNAIAGDVAGAITDLLQRQADVARLQEGVSLRQQIESEVVVVPEVTTNSLLISSTPRFYSKLLSVIEKLDEAPPQVVIQVLIVQVDLDKSNEFGIEVGLQDSVLFRRGIFPGVSTLTPAFTPQGVSITTNSPVTPGIPGFNFNSTSPLGNNPFTNNSDWVGGQSLSNLGVGRSSSVGYGGLVLSASSESVNVLLRALARDQKIEVLSRPQVMALDNQTAFIQVGQQVPLIQNSVIQANVGVVNTVTYQDVGIILVVTPKISPDGSVVLRVDPEISALAPITDVDSRVEISTGVFARAINTTRAQTTVSARDGQTAVIGGLIRRETSRETRKVPLLGDVPVIGWGFKYEQKRCLKRELLFFLTPHIVRGQDDAERIKQVEAARMNWCLSACELAELGLPPKPEAETPKVDKKSGHFWQRWRKEKPAPVGPPPGAMEGLLPTTVTHEPPPMTGTMTKLDPTLWPTDRPRSKLAPGAGAMLTPAKAEIGPYPASLKTAPAVPGNSTAAPSANEPIDEPAGASTKPLALPMRWKQGNRSLSPPAPLPPLESATSAGRSSSAAPVTEKAMPGKPMESHRTSGSKAASSPTESAKTKAPLPPITSGSLPKTSLPQRVRPQDLPQ